MTNIDIVEMAREAGFKEHNDMIYVTTINDDCAKELERFAALIRADEREACAKVADHWRDTDDWPCGDGIGRAIRARSNT